MAAVGITLSVAPGCASVTDDVASSPDVDTGRLRAQRERAVIFVDRSAEGHRAAAVWRAYFEAERGLDPSSVSVWRANRRAGRRLASIEDFVPRGGRLWVVWLAGDRGSLRFEQAVAEAAEGPHGDVVMIEHAPASARSEPVTVRWRGEVGELLSPLQGGRVRNAWTRTETPTNVGSLHVGGLADRERAARAAVRALAAGLDADGDGFAGLAEIDVGVDPGVSMSPGGVNLVVDVARAVAAAPSSAWSAAVDPVEHLPTGSFSRGCAENDDECEPDEFPRRRIWLPGFAIDTHEVTWAEYAECVAAEYCPPIDADRCYVYDPDQGFVRGTIDVEAIDPDAPMTCATWPQAAAFCEFRGQALPTESQWERAARGNIQAIHLTSDAPPTCDEAVSDGCGTVRRPETTSRLNTIGIADLVGNLSEWTRDWYDHDAYQRRHHDRAPASPETGDVKVVRGGSFYDPDTFLRVSYRYGLSPQFGYDIVGFRCAR